MGWLAWSGGSDRKAAHHSVTPQANIATGALVLEAPLPSDTRVETLLDVTCQYPQTATLRIQSIPSEGLSVFIKSGSAECHTVISHRLGARTDSIRLTLNWDAPNGTGLIAIEYPGDDRLFTRSFSGSIALPGSLILGTLADMHDPDVLQNLTYVAFHKGPLLIGPSPTLDYHTPVFTPQGYRKIGTIKPGDTVVSASGNIVPVLGVLKKTTPAFGSNEPIQLRAPYFGLQTDIIMAGTQRVIIEGSDVEYTFGCDHVRVPARYLVNGTAAAALPRNGLATYFQLLLPESETIIASELNLESLFISRLRRNKDIYPFTTLAQLPRNRVPEHIAHGEKVLGPYEAASLADMRVA
ncbi:Hint domain-containing protein [Planktotalea sp.]|uniref:Hint domain-containing protein n=1 Tax=Planktotalea sp. TaxID=2029877 RepID=UPI003296C320